MGGRLPNIGKAFTSVLLLTYRNLANSESWSRDKATVDVPGCDSSHPLSSYKAVYLWVYCLKLIGKVCSLISAWGSALSVLD